MFERALIFVGGVAVGSAVTYLLMKNKMERDLEEQIEDVKRVYSDRYEEEALEEEEAEAADEESEVVKAMDPKVAKKLSIENMKKKDDLFHVEKLISEENYRTNYNAFSKPMPEEELKDMGNGADDDDDEDEDDGPDLYPREGVQDAPYVISQEEFINGNKYYDKTTLNYYDDGILEDEITEEIIDDIDAVIGRDSLTKFGEYEDDVVFVRNERLSTDYEVVRQYRDFAQIPRDDSD